MSNLIVKALSIMQPWVDAHLFLGKPVENRTWRPSHALIGQRIALHASAKVDKQGMAFIRKLPLPIPEAAELLPPPQLSAILGTAVLAGYVVEEFNSIDPTWKRYGNVPSDYDPSADSWLFGPVGLVWRDVQRLVEPIPCKGALGFWNIPSEIQAMLAMGLKVPAVSPMEFVILSGIEEGFALFALNGNVTQKPIGILPKGFAPR